MEKSPIVINIHSIVDKLIIINGENTGELVEKVEMTLLGIIRSAAEKAIASDKSTEG